MSLYISFGIVTLLSTVSGVVIFSILFNRHDQPLSDRIGAGFAGAFLGTLAGLITTMTYHVDEGGIGWYLLLMAFGSVFAVWLQKFLADAELQKLISHESDDRRE